MATRKEDETEMTKNSKIEWTDHTFNPWIGCAKISDGCKNCYAEAMMDKRYGKVKWGVQGKRIRTSAANWKKPLEWNRQAEHEGRRYRVFCASLADVFEHKPDQHKEMEQWRFDLFRLIDDTPKLDWLLLTKRPENVMDMLRHDWADQLPSNVWIGTSVENQERADKRIPELLKIPAAVRFLSIEPLLGEVDLISSHFGLLPGIHWVIVGGESGANARPMHPDWVRSIRAQCQAAGVPFFFKQWGEWFPCFDSTVSSQYLFSDGERVARIGKKAAGRLLDGREWNELPNT